MTTKINLKPYKPNKKKHWKIVDSKGKTLLKFHSKACALNSLPALKLTKHEKLKVLPLE